MVDDHGGSQSPNGQARPTQPDSSVRQPGDAGARSNDAAEIRTHPGHGDRHATHNHHHRHHQHNHHHAGHHHAGHPSSVTSSRAFAIAVILNVVFVVLEFVYGFLANSTALMADAGHNLSDVLGLLLAWGASVLARREPGGRYTYGLRSTSILAALFNAMLLLVACGAIALEAIQRLLQPSLVTGLVVTLVAAIGILINGFSAWLFMAGRRDDINVRGAYLHLLADAAVSFAVVISGLAMMATGWFWLDPLLSLLIVAVIVIGTWRLLREAMRMAVNAVPAHIDLSAVESFFAAQSGVTEVHDLHVWPMSTTESALTVTLVIPELVTEDSFLDRLALELQSRFNIGHSTIQVRRGAAAAACVLARP